MSFPGEQRKEEEECQEEAGSDVVVPGEEAPPFLQVPPEKRAVSRAQQSLMSLILNSKA